MIEVKNLTKRYGSHFAVDDLSFTVEKGQIYGFLGPNGAGKSTTMNIMTGYLGATKGTVLINGHDILKEPQEARKCIGYLPEQPPLYMEMTVSEYLKFAAELKKIPRSERETQIDKVVRMARLRDVMDRMIQNLSKGFRQRVGLAQAILGFPEIIILDEPTVGLDPKQIIEIRELIRKLAKEHTVILSSHILAEVREVCDHILIISNGKLAACDTPENLENLMSGSGRVEIEAKGTVNEVKKIVGKIRQVKQADYQEKDSGVTEAQIYTDGKEDIREVIFMAFSEAKLPLLTLKESKSSLEEIFLELTQGNSRAVKRIRELERKKEEETENESNL